MRAQSDGSDIICISRNGVRVVLTEEIAAFAEEIAACPESLMENEKFLKADTTCDVAAVKLGEIKVIVKRYNKKGFFHTLKQNFKPSRAKRCWYWGRKLREIEVNTPKPLGYIEVRKYGIRQLSYLITEFIDGQRLCNILKEADRQQMQQLSQSVLDILKKLDEHNIVHRDFQSRNILVCQGKPYLIDLDSMRRTIFITKIYDKDKDKNHLIRKLKRDCIECGEVFN